MVSSATCVQRNCILIHLITSDLVFIVIGIWPLTQANVFSKCIFFVSGGGVAFSAYNWRPNNGSSEYAFIYEDLCWREAMAIVWVTSIGAFMHHS